MSAQLKHITASELSQPEFDQYLTEHFDPSPIWVMESVYDKQWQLDPNALDLAVARCMRGEEVVVELCGTHPEPQALMQVTTSGGFDLAIRDLSMISEFASAWVSNTAFRGHLYPITSFVEHWVRAVAEEHDPMEMVSMPSDPYVSFYAEQYSKDETVEIKRTIMDVLGHDYARWLVDQGMPHIVAGQK